MCFNLTFIKKWTSNNVKVSNKSSMYLPISMSYNMLIRSLLWFVKYRFIILLFCAIYCYLPDYLLLNFITNCEKKNCLLFYLHFFFSEVDFYCSYVDCFVDGFVFSNPQIENNKICFEMQLMLRMCFDRKFTFKPSPFN